MKSVVIFSKSDYGYMRISIMEALSDLELLEESVGENYYINEARRHLEDIKDIIYTEDEGV